MPTAAGDSMTGRTFIANAYGYRYRWEVRSDILQDKTGSPFIWAAPVERLGGKQGRLTRPVVFHLSIFSEEYARRFMPRL